MHKFFLGFMRKPTRSQIKASYRLSANRRPAEQPGENHFNAGGIFGLHSLEYRQELRQVMRKLKRITR